MLLRLLAGFPILLVPACHGRAPEPPAAEFMVATPDSSYWVSSGPQGIHVRVVPMTLTRYDGHFHEVFVADVDRSFGDAVFAGERVYQRDLTTGDSTLVYDDSAVVQLAARYARTHPRAMELAPDEDTPDEPSITATGETDVVDVRGPYALLEHRSSFQHTAGEHYDTVRTAVDLRTGRLVTPAELLLDSAAVNGSSTLRSPPRAWRRAGYTLLARGDSAASSASLSLRDGSEHIWPLFAASTSGRILWLDEPPLDTASRRALAHAFNEAAAYSEAVTFVRLARPHPGNRPSHRMDNTT